MIVDHNSRRRAYISKLTLENEKFLLAKWIWTNWHKEYDAPCSVDFSCHSLDKEVKTLSDLERSTARAHDFNHLVPLPIVVMTKVVGLPSRALMDSGLLGDFISTTLVDQLELTRA